MFSLLLLPFRDARARLHLILIPRLMIGLKAVAVTMKPLISLLPVPAGAKH
jgi:hypothetical protein